MFQADYDKGKQKNNSILTAEGERGTGNLNVTGCNSNKMRKKKGVSDIQV